MRDEDNEEISYNRYTFSNGVFLRNQYTGNYIDIGKQEIILLLW